MIDPTVLRTLCEQATPGPWKAQGVMVTGNGLDVCLTDFDAGPDEPYALADAKLIAALRNNIAPLLDENAALRAHVRSAEGEVVMQAVRRFLGMVGPFAPITVGGLWRKLSALANTATYRLRKAARVLRYGYDPEDV